MSDVPGYQTAAERRRVADAEAAVQHVEDEKAAVRALVDQMKLSHASAAGDVDAVDAALLGGGDLGSADMSGLRPMHHAAMNGQTRMAHYLLGAGADADGRTGNKASNTPLHCAAANGQADVVAVLLRLGADPTILNNVSDAGMPSLPGGGAAAQVGRLSAAVARDLSTALRGSPGCRRDAGRRRPQRAKTHADYFPTPLRLAAAAAREAAGGHGPGVRRGRNHEAAAACEGRRGAGRGARGG